MSKLIPSCIILGFFVALCPTEEDNPFQEDLEEWAEVAQMLKSFINGRKAVRYAELRRFCLRNDVSVYQWGGPRVDVGLLLIRKLAMFK